MGMSKNNEMIINDNGKECFYKLLYVLEFDSTRKRMSVILREKSGEVLIYTKGADNVILARTNKKDLESKEVKNLKIHLDDFAKEGQRTLLLAKKNIDASTYKIWAEKYEKARSSIDN